MKKIGMLFIVLVLGINMSFGQPGGRRNVDPEESAKRQVERLDEALNLNDDQEKKVYEISLEASKEMQKVRQNSGGGFEGMREKWGEIREEQDKKLKKVLTDDQWVKYEKYQEERRERMRQRRGN